MLEFLFILILAGLGLIVMQLFSEVRSLRERIGRLERQARDRGSVETSIPSLPSRTPAPEPAPAAWVPDSGTIPPRIPEPTVARTGLESGGPPEPQTWPRQTEPLPPLAIPAMPPPPRPEPKPAWAAVDWERFMGVRLFAWLGGLALFLAVAYFVKYSFDRNLIPPSLRVLIGMLMGVGLVVGGVMVRRREYVVTSQTFCGTGVVVLYASLFAGHGLYHLDWLTQGSSFAGMSMVTAMAFILAVRMRALVVAVLGILGGFLTPVLLSSGQDQPVALFSYLALLDVGLIAVALRARWPFLTTLGALATAILQLGWMARYFDEDRVGLAFVVFVGFTALFLAGLAVARRDEKIEGRAEWLSAAVAVSALTTLVLVGIMLGIEVLAAQPGRVFAFVLASDLALLAVAWWRGRVAWLHAVAGGIAFLYLLGWMAQSLTPALLGWSLGLSLVFAALHAGFPLVLQRFKPGVAPIALAQVFPPVALLGLLVPLMKLDPPSFAVWPVVMLVSLMALALAAFSSGLMGALVALLLSVVASAIWIGKLPSELGDVGVALIIVVGMSALFVSAGIAMLRRRPVSSQGMPGPGFQGVGGNAEDQLRLQLPVAAALLPFLLLCQLMAQIRLPEPSLVFVALTAMLAMLFVLTRWLRFGPLPMVGLVGLALAEWIWASLNLPTASHPAAVMAWVVGFQLLFAAFPPLFLSDRKSGGGKDAKGDAEPVRDTLAMPWVAAAVSGLPQFLIGYQVIKVHWPNDAMGLVPLAFGIPAAATLGWLLRCLRSDHPGHASRVAWFGGMTLFFITVAVPIQFDRQWVTLGFALEGAALLWLFRRVRHPGLRLTGVGLLMAAFQRLVLNPFVLEYAVREPVRIPLANWWLYTYGLTAAALYLGAWLLPRGEEKIRGTNARSLLLTCATLLLFALVNLEIADYFTPIGQSISFEFSGNFGRDMSYTIAWAVFALALVMVGLGRRVVAARWAGLVLLGVAALKLFLHDLANLDQLYRIGALAGVAVVAIAASVLYQRFVARDADASATPRG